MADLADSNMAHYNSDLAQKVRKAAADSEAAWEGVGKEVGIRVWRIQNFSVVDWPKEEYGNFFSGDSYIVLETYKPDPNEENLDYNVFFWLGKDTTQDEYGTAAYKTVELDDKLGGEPVQYREVEGLESHEFETLFPTMRTMNGGVKSAFNKVKPEEYDSRLYIVKGKNKNTVKMTQVPMEISSLNLSDTFVLDAGLLVYGVLNSSASVWEKRKANAYVDRLQGERPKVKTGIVTDLDDGQDEFWDFLGGKPDSLPETGKVVEEKEEDDGIDVYEISDSTKGKVVMTSVEVESDDNGLLSRTCLESNKVILIYFRIKGRENKMGYIWTGKGASKSERQFAMPVILEEPQFARIPFRRLHEGKETKEFINRFNNW